MDTQLAKLDEKVVKFDRRIVNVWRESTYLKFRSTFRSFWGDDERFISIGELFDALAHGSPGLYILRGS